MSAMSSRSVLALRTVSLTRHQVFLDKVWNSNWHRTAEEYPYNPSLLEWDYFGYLQLREELYRLRGLSYHLAQP